MNGVRISFLIALVIAASMVGCAVQPSKTSNEATAPDMTFKPQYELAVPTKDTAAQMFDELAYQRAVQVYLWGLPAVGTQQYRVANGGALGGGSDAYKVGYLGGLMKSSLLHLTGNPDSMYIDYFFDTHDGPLVMEVPPTLPGFLTDMWEIPVVDVIEKVSPSGKYLIVPPGWKGVAPAGHVVVRPNTYVSWMLLRGNVEQTAGGPDTTRAVAEMKSKLKIYPLSAAKNPSARPRLQFIDITDKSIDRIPPEGLAYFNRLAEVVTTEPLTQTNEFMMGFMKSLGMEPGKPFKPDARTTKILERAAETGMAMARSIAFQSEDPERWHWPDRKYAEAFMGGSPTFAKDGHVNHDARITFFYLACGTSQLMASTTPGQVFFSSSCPPITAAGVAAPMRKPPLVLPIVTISAIFLTSMMTPGAWVPAFIWTRRSVPPARMRPLPSAAAIKVQASLMFLATLY